MRNKFILFSALFFVLSSCLKELDFSTFIYSKARVEERFKQSMEWNETHPYRTIETTDEDYRLIITGDIHVGGPKTNNNYEKLLARAVEGDITAVAYLGDLASGRKEDEQKFHDILNPDSIVPSFALIGNHDLYFDGWAGFSAVHGTSVYYFEVKTPTKKDLYICLDSGNGVFGDSQVAWLRNLLKNSVGKYDRQILMTHSNFSRIHYTASTSPIMEEMIGVMDLVEEYQVDMVISGHDHRRAIQTFGNTDYIILDALRDDAKNATYMMLQKKVMVLTMIL